MKNLVTSLVLFFSLFTIFGQQTAAEREYTVDVRGYIGQAESTCNTSGLQYIALHFKTGPKKYVYGSTALINNSNTSFSSTTAVFTAANPITEIEVVSRKRFRSNAGGCEEGRNDIVFLDLSTADLDCYYKEYLQAEVFPRHFSGFRSYARVYIDAKPKIWYTDTKVDIKSIKIGCPSGIGLEATPGFENTDSAYRWQFYDNISTKVITHPDYEELLEKLKKAEEDADEGECSNGCEDEDQIVIPRSCIEDCMAKGAVQVAKIQKEIDNYKASGKPLTQVVNDHMWLDIDSQRGKSSINLQLSDLFASEADQQKIFGKPIDIRIKRCSFINENLSNNQLAVQFVPAPPGVDGNPDIKRPSCSGATDGGFLIYFDRSISTSEEVNMTLFKRDPLSIFDPLKNNNGSINSLTEFNKIYTQNQGSNNDIRNIAYAVRDGEYSGYDASETTYTWVGGIKGGAGHYAINISTVVRDASGTPGATCEPYYYFFEIKEPDPINFDVEATKPSCSTTANDGRLKITSIINGSGNYEYSIDGGSWASVTTNINGLSGGIHTVKVRDAVNTACESAEQTVEIETLVKLQVNDVTFENPATSGSATGSITIGSITGGLPFTDTSGNPYYEVEEFIYDNIRDDEGNNNFRSPTSGFIRENLKGEPFDYSYSIRDKAGCSVFIPYIELKDPKEPLDFKAELGKNPSCSSDSDGQINITDVEGTYDVKTIEWTPKNGGILVGNSSITNLPNGTYSVTVIDNRDNSKTVTNIPLNTPKLELTKVEETVSIKCYGEKARVELTAEGGFSSNYEYGIQIGGNFIWGKDFDFFEEPNVFVLPANDLSGYRFAVRNSDSPSCFTLSEIVKISQPSELYFSNIETVNNTKNGAKDGSINIKVNGGSGSKSFKWTREGDGFTANTEDIENLLAGTYTLEVTYGGGCTETSEPIKITEPNILTVSITESTPIACFGGQGTLTANPEGGYGAYTYQWLLDRTAISGATNAVLKDVTEGDYSVTITDEGVVTTTSSDFPLNEPELLTLGVSATDVSCFEGSNGTLILSPEGGTAPYSFSLDNSTFTLVSSLSVEKTIENLPKGDYMVWLKDVNGCELGDGVAVNITEPNSIKVDPTIEPSTTNAGTDGSISIDVTEGIAPYEYAWTKQGDDLFEEDTKDISNLSLGIYTVVVTDDKGCSVTREYEVKQPDKLAAPITLTTPILCHGDATGEITATVSGGFPLVSTPIDFEYEWYVVTDTGDVLLERGFGLESQSGLVVGGYKVIVTDTVGTKVEAEYVITQPDDLQVKLTNTPINVLCFGEETGAIDVTVVGGPTDEITGGYLAYEFEWTKEEDADFTVTTEDLVNIGAGTYRLTVIDSNSCETTLSAPVIITQPLAGLTIADSNITNLTGFETNNGSISVGVKGGTEGYSYAWRLAGNDDIIGDAALIENLAIGTYELTVTDANSCSEKGIYTIIQPTLLVITNIEQQGVVLCNGDKSVNLLATVDGGVTDYTYSWYVEGDTATKISTTEVLSAITGGSYTVVVTDANGNEAKQTYVVFQPDILEASFTTTNVSCNGGNDGAIDVSVIGGTGTYSYSWATSETIQDLSGLVAGNYSVIIRDANLCETTLNISIGEPTEALNVLEATIENTSGFELTNGTIEVNIVGGTPEYIYEWTDSEGTILTSITNLLEGIGAGDYFLKVTDANDCVLEPEKYVVSEPSKLIVRTEEVSIDCFENTGALNALVEGGVPPYSYAWYNAATELVSEESSATDIPADTYSIIVIDAKANQTELNDIELTHPNLLEIDAIDITNVTCYQGDDGSIRITAIGGTGDYLYQWSHTNVSSNEVTALLAGEYTVTITDENTCSVTSEIINVIEPAPYEIISVNLVRPSGIISADNGSITINITGGVAPFTYEWYDSDTNSILLETDVFNTSSSITTSEGVYSVKVIDAIGCEMGDTYNLADPGELLVNVEQNQPVSCFGNNDGILEVITVGGVGGNNYQWYSRTATADRPITGERASILRNLAIGSYFVVVSNAEGISEQSAVFEVTQPDAVIGSLTMDMPDCYQGNDGSITLTASGGDSDYSYRYRKDRAVYSDWISFNGNETMLSTLSKGFYEIQLTDSNGCFYETLSRGIQVLRADITEPDELVISDSLLKEPTGFNLSNGVITITVQGGTLPYTYEWTSETGEQLLETTNELSGILAGIYNVNITDSQQCNVSLEMTLGQPEELLVTIEEVNVISCFESSNASLRAKATGGIVAYTYEWFEVSNTVVIGDEALLEDIGQGEYYVLVTDANGNKKQSENILVVEPELLEVRVTADYTLCGDGNDWTIESSVQGGTAPYTYFWSTGTTDSSIDNVDLGTYIIYVSDARGCRTNLEIVLELPQGMEVADNITNTTCFEGEDASIRLSVLGGVAPYSYAWDNGASGPDVFNLKEGSYQVSITDAKGCEVVHSYQIIDPAQIVVDLGSDITLCAGQEAELDATINDPNATYSWTSANGFTSNQPNVVVNATGVYQVNVISGVGCTATASVFVDATTDEIVAHFLTSTQVFVGEEFVIVDNSVPFPDTKQWELPNEAIVSFSDENYVELHFDTPGEYEVTMFAERGLCSAFQTKTIVVLDKEFDSTGAVSTAEELKSFIDFDLYPNPSAGGNFTIDIELSEVADVSLKLFSMANNVVLDTRGNKGSNEYNFIYDMSGLASGIYFLSLEVSNGMNRVHKLVVN